MNETTSADARAWARVGIRCSAIMSATIVVAIGAAWTCPRTVLGYPDDVVGAALTALGSFALATACVNFALAAAIFWAAPETRSIRLNAAILLPAAVVLFYPAINVA